MKQSLDNNSTLERQGFTLIEIMLVLAVIGIIAIVTVPKYQAVIDHYDLESSAQIVVGQLRFAKQLAMDQRKEIYVAMGRTTVDVLDSSNVEYGGQQAFESVVNFNSTSAFSNGLKIDSAKAHGLPYLVYDARGFVENSPGSGGTVNIGLTSMRTGRTVVIVVEVQTGHVRVQW